jgi:hypothetical protein
MPLLMFVHYTSSVCPNAPNARGHALVRFVRFVSLLHPPSKRVKIDLELIRLESGRAALAVGPHIPTVHELLTELLCGVVVGRRKREQRPWRMTKCRKALLGRLFHLTPSPHPRLNGPSDRIWLSRSRSRCRLVVVGRRRCKLIDR